MSNKNKISKQDRSELLNIADVRIFYFKVNNSKLQDESRLKNQIEKVIKRLVERNNIHSKSIELSFGTVDDDFVFDRCRLRISFNLQYHKDIRNVNNHKFKNKYYELNQHTTDDVKSRNCGKGK